MKRVATILQGLSAVMLLMPALAFADTAKAPDVFITEIQTSSSSSASEEFIELYNNTDNNIDLGSAADAWKLQYFSSTKVTTLGFDWGLTSPTGTINLTGTIPAHNYFLLSTSNGGVAYMPNGVTPDQTYPSPHLADTGGGVRLIDVNGTTTTEHDHIGWSNGVPLMPGLMANPPAGGSLQRNVTDSGNYVDDQGALQPIVLGTTMSPKAAYQAPVPVDDIQTTGDLTQTDGPLTQTTDGQVTDQTATSQLTVRINELLPNPASPATDANDEFVEIYNYGTEPINLSGLTIQTGATYSYSYTITDGTLDAGAYKVFTSGDTPLTLSNSNGQARILGPEGQVLSASVAYSDAPEGESWAFENEGWQWTTTPTPGAANVITAPVIATKKTTAKTTTKKTTAKKASAVKSSKTSKAGVAGAGNGADQNTADIVPPIHPAVLAVVGGLALLYGAYEYRHDFANKLYKLRKYRETRRAARPTTAGR